MACAKPLEGIWWGSVFAGSQEQEREGAVSKRQSTQGLIIIIRAIGSQSCSRRMSWSLCICWIKEGLSEPAQVKGGQLGS